MTYEQAIEAVVTRREAIDEIAAHGLDFSDFVEEYGNREEYQGADVLDWLGY